MNVDTTFLIFDVALGQSVVIHPHGYPEYTTMIDCGSKESQHPIDLVHRKGWLSYDFSIRKSILHNLTVTNYDCDHFSDLPHIVENYYIRTVRMAGNMTPEEIEGSKEEITEPVEAICNVRREYTHPYVPSTPPPISLRSFSLSQDECRRGGISVPSTNDLSQLVFAKVNGKVVCFTGDLTVGAWKLLLENEDVQTWLMITDIYFASHHGREDGYCEEVFDYCRPDCIIISDCDLRHATQDGMTERYKSHVNEDGIDFEGTTRWVLTTRCDGAIKFVISSNGTIIFSQVPADELETI